MVMQPLPVYRAYEEARRRITEQAEGREKKTRVVYLTPQGRIFDQPMAKELAREEELIFLCGHYEELMSVYWKKL